MANLISNPKTLTWTNPATYIDGSAYGQADNAGYQIAFDGQPAISIPLSWGTSFDLVTLAAYTALKKGTHTLALAPVSVKGVVGAFSSASFSVDLAPSAVTNLALV